MKKICFILALTLAALVVSAKIENSPVDAASNSPMSTIQNLTYYINTGKWGSIPNLWVRDMEKVLSPFFNNPANKNNKVGFFNIKKAKIIDWKELTFEEASSFTNEKDARYFYISIDNEVFQEDKYHMNGVNYYFVALIEENGHWRIAQFSTAPVDILVSNNLGFGTTDEKQMASIFEQRKKGLYLNREGKILEKNQGTNEGNHEKKGNPCTDFMDTALYPLAYDHTPPTSIRVYISNLHNVNSYGCLGCVKIPTFNYYIQNVLPNEWYSTWPIDSLRAGAFAVKMYGWYATYYPLASSVGADVFDDERSQSYKTGTSVTRTTQALFDISNKGLHRADNSNLFLTEYRSGSYASGGKSTGYLWQNGSKYWADLGYNHSYILITTMTDPVK